MHSVNAECVGCDSSCAECDAAGADQCTACRTDAETLINGA